MELFLTSSVHAVARDVAKHVDMVNKKLVFINTAAETKGKDKQWLKNDQQALVDAGFDITDFTITGKTKDQLETDLADFDFIYMSGGDTVHLLEQSQKSGFMDLVQDLVKNRGKFYIGTSAGSIITGPKLPDYFDENEKLENRRGYGLVNFTILPHWGREDFRDKYLGTEERLKIVYKDDQVPLLLLTDNQYVHVKDNKIEIVDVGVYNET